MEFLTDLELFLHKAWNVAKEIYTDMSWLRVGDVCRILACNQHIVNERIKLGSFKVRIERDRYGRLFNILDVFRYAYPWADDSEISKLIMQYRSERAQRLKSLKHFKRKNRGQKSLELGG